MNLSPGLELRAQGNVAKIASGNGQRLAVANNRQIGVWDVTRRTRLLLLDFDLLGVPTFLGALALSSDGTRLASGNEDGFIRVWEVPSGQLLYQFKAHSGQSGRSPLTLPARASYRRRFLAIKAFVSGACRLDAWSFL